LVNVNVVAEVPVSLTLAPRAVAPVGVVVIVPPQARLAVLVIVVEFCGTPITMQSALVVSSFAVPLGHAGFPLSGSIGLGLSEMSWNVQPDWLTVTVSVPPRLSVQFLNVGGFSTSGELRSGPGPMSGPLAKLLVHVTLSTLDVKVVCPLTVANLICHWSGSPDPNAPAAYALTPITQSAPANTTMNLLVLDLKNLFVLDFIITFLDGVLTPEDVRT
jgi:hypothetical protein